MKEELKAKVDSYLAKETNPHFIADVENVVKKGDLDELNDRFYRELEFGTAGLRGVIAGGLNRMNDYVVEKTTQGLANYLNKQKSDAKVVISYDSRHYSKEFATLTARVLASNGIKAYIFSELAPTPVLAFATTHLKADAGIMITASHNPAEYNGYKVFQGDGSQITSPADKEILAEIDNVSVIEKYPEANLISNGKIEYLGEELDKLYFEMAYKVVNRPNLFANKDLKVIYTPLHGTGGKYVAHLFDKFAVNYKFVEEQKEPNGDFPTVGYPNPEETAGLAMALALAKKENADLVIATDPDADRMAVALKSGGDYLCLNGNQMGILFADYLLAMNKEAGKDMSSLYIVKSIVTSLMEESVATSYGAKCYAVLTGFKWIADMIRKQEGKAEFVFGNEEAIGYLVEKAIRDKDGLTAAITVVEMALYYASKKMTLEDRLEELYKQHGFYHETQISKNYPGESGMATMKAIMSTLRAKGLEKIGSRNVVKTLDYLTKEIKDASGKVLEQMSYEKSDVLQFILDDGSRLSVRPSGTEPKIKFYCSACVPNYTGKSDKVKADSFGDDVKAVIENLVK